MNSPEKPGIPWDSLVFPGIPWFNRDFWLQIIPAITCYCPVFQGFPRYSLEHEQGMKTRLSSDWCLFSSFSVKILNGVQICSPGVVVARRLAVSAFCSSDCQIRYVKIVRTVVQGSPRLTPIELWIDTEKWQVRQYCLFIQMTIIAKTFLFII